MAREYGGVLVRGFNELGLEVLLMFHWLGLDYMATPNYKADWEIRSSYMFWKERRIVFVNGSLGHKDQGDEFQ